MIINILASVLIFVGIFFSFAGVIGIFRMKDIFCKLQASTNISTLGAISLFLGCSIHSFNIGNLSIGLRCIIITIFLIIVNPVASHYMARTAYKINLKFCDETILDEYKEE